MENDFVICMRCQGSFDMDHCQPLEDSGNGFVYCKKCSKEILFNRAKAIIRSYLDYNTGEDVRILGEDHPYEICESSIGEVREAFNLLDRNSFFEELRVVNLQEEICDRLKVLEIYEDSEKIVELTSQLVGIVNKWLKNT